VPVRNKNNKIGTLYFILAKLYYTLYISILLFKIHVGEIKLFPPHVKKV
jgi:hypothetical protein